MYIGKEACVVVVKIVIYYIICVYDITKMFFYLNYNFLLMVNHTKWNWAISFSNSI